MTARDDEAGFVRPCHAEARTHWLRADIHRPAFHLTAPASTEARTGGASDESFFRVESSAETSSAEQTDAASRAAIQADVNFMDRTLRPCGPRRRQRWVNLFSGVNAGGEERRELVVRQNLKAEL